MSALHEAYECSRCGSAFERGDVATIVGDDVLCASCAPSPGRPSRVSLDDDRADFHALLASTGGWSRPGFSCSTGLHRLEVITGEVYELATGSQAELFDTLLGTTARTLGEAAGLRGLDPASGRSQRRHFLKRLPPDFYQRYPHLRPTT